MFSVRMEKGQCSANSEKDDKQILKNYTLVSLLPICAKNFERMIYNKFLEFLINLEFLITGIQLRETYHQTPSYLLMVRLFFPVVHDLNTSTNNLNEDLKKINDWANQWKMSFNLDPTKQAQEVIFFRKIKKPLHTPHSTYLQQHKGQINCLSKTFRFNLRQPTKL